MSTPDTIQTLLGQRAFAFQQAGLQATRVTNASSQLESVNSQLGGARGEVRAALLEQKTDLRMDIKTFQESRDAELLNAHNLGDDIDECRSMIERPQPRSTSAGPDFDADAAGAGSAAPTDELWG